MRPQGLTLDSDIFEEFRVILNSSIRATLREMIEQGVRGATITAKIDIDLASRVDDDTGEIFYQPDLDPKVSTKLGKRADHRLKKLDGFIMKPDGNGGFIIGTKQVEMSELFAEG